MIDLAHILADYTGQGRMRLWIAYFTEIQKALQKSKYPDLNITLMRRMMLRIATKLAQREGALALITGDSLGQVASQTMESLHVINAVTSIPVLRPLIGHDKQEIIDLARKIGTYETSILPYEDCCTVFVALRPPNPASSRCWPPSSYDVDALVDEALAKTESVAVSSAVQIFS